MPKLVFIILSVFLQITLFAQLSNDSCDKIRLDMLRFGLNNTPTFIIKNIPDVNLACKTVAQEKALDSFISQTMSDIRKKTADLLAMEQRYQLLGCTAKTGTMATFQKWYADAGQKCSAEYFKNNKNAKKILPTLMLSMEIESRYQMLATQHSGDLLEGYDFTGFAKTTKHFNENFGNVLLESIRTKHQYEYGGTFNFLRSEQYLQLMGSGGGDIPKMSKAIRKALTFDLTINLAQNTSFAYAENTTTSEYTINSKTVKIKVTNEFNDNKDDKKQAEPVAPTDEDKSTGRKVYTSNEPVKKEKDYETAGSEAPAVKPMVADEVDFEAASNSTPNNNNTVPNPKNGEEINYNASFLDQILQHLKSLEPPRDANGEVNTQWNGPIDLQASVLEKIFASRQKKIDDNYEKQGYTVVKLPYQASTTITGKDVNSTTKKIAPYNHTLTLYASLNGCGDTLLLGMLLPEGVDDGGHDQLRLNTDMFGTYTGGIDPLSFRSVGNNAIEYFTDGGYAPWNMKGSGFSSIFLPSTKTVKGYIKHSPYPFPKLKRTYNLPYADEQYYKKYKQTMPEANMVVFPIPLVSGNPAAGALTFSDTFTDTLQLGKNQSNIVISFKLYHTPE